MIDICLQIYDKFLNMQEKREKFFIWEMGTRRLKLVSCNCHPDGTQRLKDINWFKTVEIYDISIRTVLAENTIKAI